NLDGKVDVTDLGNLASNYGMSSGARLAQGDFNYDGNVDVTDLGDLASNYGAVLTDTSAGGASAAAIPTSVVAAPLAAAGSASVPEPTSSLVLLLGSLGALSRRRRH